ncbi:type IIL restriction-modification enzyme MmeI, partial [Acinetobacter venetianus]|uniref:type IIL restriction-modification enzyme MmeI n=1 Tax=Acinetobacter venetianus TaxID=52133 RepID=UPI0033133500
YCVILGITKKNNECKLFNNNLWIKVNYINPYLTESNIGCIKNRSSSVSNLPEIGIGNKPIDGGLYLFSQEEKEKFIINEPASEPYFRKWWGAQELKSGVCRWCLFVQSIPEDILESLPLTLQRIKAVQDFRLSSTSKPTQKLAEIPKKFHVENFPKQDYIVIPEVSSEVIDYLPIGYITKKDLSSNLLNVLDTDDIFYLSLLSSKMHLLWVETVSGRFGNGIRYSCGLSYNTFPFPKVTATQMEKGRIIALKILEMREKYSSKSLGKLYSSEMPKDLKELHLENDRFIESIYKSNPFNDDSERLNMLFKLYEKMNNRV